MLPGMIHAHDELGRQIAEMQARLAQLQDGGNALDAVNELRRRGAKSAWAKHSPEERSAIMKERWAKKKAAAGKKGGGASYWAKMTKEERQAEMRRRVAVRDKKWAEAANVDKLHPRDPRSPRHDAWIKKMRKVSKESWTKLTPGQREARLAKTGGLGRLNGEAVQ